MSTNVEWIDATLINVEVVLIAAATRNPLRVNRFRIQISATLIISFTVREIWTVPRLACHYTKESRIITTARLTPRK